MCIRDRVGCAWAVLYSTVGGPLVSVVAGMRKTVRRCSWISPPGGNKGSWAAVDVDGFGSCGAVLSFLSDLPVVGFLLEGIFLSEWKYGEEVYYWQRIVFKFVCYWLTYDLDVWIGTCIFTGDCWYFTHETPTSSCYLRVRIISTVVDINLCCHWAHDN